MVPTTQDRLMRDEIQNLNDVRASKKAALTIKEVARVLQLDIRTISGAASNGELPCVRVGRRVLIPREAFLALLENNKSQVPNA